MSQDFQHLLSPLDVGRRTLRNRVLITGHVPGLADRGYITDAFIEYHRVRARGGAGLQSTGSTQIHRTGSIGGLGRGPNNLLDGMSEGYKRLSDAIHGEGGTMLVQLGHSSATVDYSDIGKPLWAPSPVASDILKQTPHAITKTEIDELIEAYASAARIAAAGNMDGVEVLAAFGYLPGAFFSPLSNRREDDYGGSLENRVRFALEAAAACRDAVGPDRIVGMRIAGDEKAPGGLDNEAMTEIAVHLAAAGTLDYLNIVAGNSYNRIMRFEHWPASPAPHGAFIPLAARIKAKVAIPVFVTGRVTDPDMAEAAIRAGHADMVGMTRAHIADPDIVAKIAGGTAGDIRPCVGANACIAHAMAGKPIRCFHNHMAAREHELGPVGRAERPKRITVIGGGPAGLEAARVAAERGHQVTLYEASGQLGGQLALWARAPFSREFAKSVAWFEQQLAKMQVRIELNREIAGADLAGLDADAVILCTGSAPAPAGQIPGAGSGPIVVTTPADILATVPDGIKHAVVADDGGGRNALAAAEVLAEAGVRVTITSGDSAIAELVDGTVRTQLYRFLLSHNANFEPMQAIARLDADTVVLRNIYTQAEKTVCGVDLVVNWRGNQVRDGLLAALNASGVDVHQVGDCLAPRTVHVAIAEGALAARAI